jgi:hypothetical protein
MAVPLQGTDLPLTVNPVALVHSAPTMFAVVAKQAPAGMFCPLAVCVAKIVGAPNGRFAWASLLPPTTVTVAGTTQRLGFERFRRASRSRCTL